MDKRFTFFFFFLYHCSYELRAIEYLERLEHWNSESGSGSGSLVNTPPQRDHGKAKDGDSVFWWTTSSKPRLRLVELSRVIFKKKSTIFAFFMCKILRKVNDPFCAGRKEILTITWIISLRHLAMHHYRMYPLIRHLTLLIATVWKKPHDIVVPMGAP